ncbi:MAG: putative LPS assembly protein LptD, partial [Alistipes sp.]|nr:putative LPS assembly protein LptD [Alistipes sp.]
MRRKKTKYLWIILCALLGGQFVFSRGTVFSAQRFESTATLYLRDDSTESKPTKSRHNRHDSLERNTSNRDTLGRDTLGRDSLNTFARPDSSDSVTRRDTTSRKAFLDEPISGKNQDSLVYDVRNKRVYIYEKGDVTYQDKNLKADFMQIDMDKRIIYAYGRQDTTKKENTRPEFTDEGNTYQMDTITYDLASQKGRLRGLTTKDGEGFLQGARVKKMKDNTINIANGRYTTCDAEHPHFYLAMTKAKTIPGKKVIIGPSYLVMEDVPIYFLGLPFGFFPTMSGRHSGFIMPTWGEEAIKGFYLRDAGYYFAFNDYIDLTVTGGIYTLGSWQASLGTRYMKRYKFRGGLNLYFSKDIVGERAEPDYINMNNFNLQWTHQQDPKFRPNSTFSASVNFATSGYSKYGSQNINEYLNTQTNSSISYSKN